MSASAVRISIHEAASYVRTAALASGQQAAQLERSILHGHVKRPMTDVHAIVARADALGAAAALLERLEAASSDLPPDLLARIEGGA